jgi:hypothetical protein
MNNFSKDELGRFDSIWTSCASGYLGSLEQGVKFVENGMDCVRPAGLASHITTSIGLVIRKK